MLQFCSILFWSQGTECDLAGGGVRGLGDEHWPVWEVEPNGLHGDAAFFCGGDRGECPLIACGLACLRSGVVGRRCAEASAVFAAWRTLGVGFPIRELGGSFPLVEISFLGRDLVLRKLEAN